jgi:two-component system NarL family sensor kinase
LNSTDEVALRERLRAERDERRRLAELIHDGPVQQVAALTQMLDAASLALETGEVDRSHQIVRRALAVAREASGELRAIVTDIEPAALDTAGFGTAVKELSARVASRRGLDVRTELSAASMLGEAAASGLYQIVRESLDQAVRRGPPTAVTVSLVESAAGGVVLEITDDGAPERRQVVLDGLAERARDLNGTFEVTRVDERTRTRVVLPPSATRL